MIENQTQKRIEKKLKSIVIIISVAFFAMGCSSKDENTNEMIKKIVIETETSNESVYKEEQTYPKTLLNPFEDLKITFLGASPFLKVNLDISMCSEQEQEYVRLTYEDKNYKIGDSVVVYATLNESSSYTNTFALEKESDSYTVENVAEWLTNVEDVDLSRLNSEIMDKLVSETTETAGSLRFGGQYLGSYITSISEPILRATYFVSLKPNLYEGFDINSNYSVFNYYIRIYDFNIQCDGTSNITHATVSCCVSMTNIKKETDGTLIWNPSLDYSSSKNNFEQLINDEIAAKRESYNVSEINN